MIAHVDEHAFLAATVLLGFGAWWFYTGFRLLRVERRVANTPVAQIGALPLGPAALTGTAHAGESLSAPFSGVQCICAHLGLYRWIRDSRGGGRWAFAGEEWLPFAPSFVLSDATGSITVLPQGADLYVDRNEYFPRDEGEDSTIAGAILEAHGLAEERVKVVEEVLLQDELLYAFGTVAPGAASDAAKTLGRGDSSVAFALCSSGQRGVEGALSRAALARIIGGPLAIASGVAILVALLARPGLPLKTRLAPPALAAPNHVQISSHR